MTISGREDDPLRVGGVGGADKPDPSNPADGVEQAQSADSANRADAVDHQTEIGATSQTDAIADALASGEIDAAQARERLIAEVVQTQLPANAPAELVAEVQAEVEALLAGDPTLLRLLER